MYKRQILFVPFGRGGSGFTVLDVTNPIVKNGQGPLHMFTVYNDYVNNTVYITDYEGKTTSQTYSSGNAEIGNSLEGRRARLPSSELPISALPDE